MTTTLTSLEFERHFASQPALALPKCWYWIRKLQARFFAADYPVGDRGVAQCGTRALGIARLLRSGGVSLLQCARASWPASIPQRTTRDSGISRLSSLTRSSRRSGRSIARRISETASPWSARRSRASKAECSTPNACTRRLSGRRASNGFVHNEALAYELAARFYSSSSLRRLRSPLLAKGPALLRAMGSRREGAAARSAVSTPQRARSSAKPDEHDGGVAGPAGPRHRDQGLASCLGRDGLGKTDRQPHAYRH